MEHIWLASERRVAQRFAAYLSESNHAGLEHAKRKWRCGTAEEVVESMSSTDQDLSKVAVYFRASKTNIVNFLRNERPVSDLYLTKLGNAPASQLQDVLCSYFTQVSLTTYFKRSFLLCVALVVSVLATILLFSCV